jgi:hypothetical protein
VGYEVTFIWGDLNPWLGMISSLGSKVEFWIPKWGKEAKEGAYLHEAFACWVRSFGAMELGFDAWGLCGGGASFVYGQQGAFIFHYFLESFHLWGGRTIQLDNFLLRLSSSHQNWEITVADWSQQQDSHSCGGDSASELSVAFQSRSGSWGGRTTFWPSSTAWAW